MTTIFDIDEATILGCLADLEPKGNRGAPANRKAQIERFARAAWGTLTEPGDATAGQVLQSAGATACLDALVRGVSVREFVALIGTQSAIEPPGEAAVNKAFERWLPRLNSNTVLQSLKLARHCGAQLLVPGDAGWPEGINDLGAHAPITLWLRGRAPTHEQAAVALVGARAASNYGQHVAAELAAGLAECGYCVTSGAAYGIDGSAHRAALSVAGTTTAFLAGGVDRFYPRGHQDLLERIVAEGAVISEMPCGTAPTRWRFLQRNRLIAAASRATVVVEAGARSGSLNTAGHAAELGRALGAVPGPVTSPSSAGCHRLLREYDAQCVTSVTEVIELFQPLTESLDELSTVSIDDRSLDLSELRLLDALSTRSPRAADDVARRSGLPLSQTQSLLGLLELSGRIVSTPEGFCAKPRPNRR